MRRIASPSRLWKRIFLSPLFLALLLTALAALAGPPLTFRSDLWEAMGIHAIPSHEAKTFSFSVDSTDKGPDRIFNPEAMKKLGGVVFVEEARPAHGVDACPKLKYQLEQPNGSRLQFVFPSKGEGHGVIYEWEIIPTINMVNSGENGLFTDMEGYAQYHAAFSNNLAGVNLFFLDNAVPLELKFPFAHLSLGKDGIPGYPQTPPTEESLEAARAVLIDLVGLDQPNHEELTQWMFTDEGIPFRFQLDSDGTVRISGSPYWVALGKNSNGHGKKLWGLGDTARTLKANQVIYSSAYRIARYAAFFRYMKNHCGPEWSEFLSDFNSKKSSLDEAIVTKMPHQLR
ncbi:hypothetical protein [Variovorax sp. dw_954]|uniref:hypothetical protein n=1 Tax=Variovorax sp. dw_954 TaxID=2720078 RepID=UPI001BD44094|nr:hypothetical protein [Variovorax sp. dw_954]